jgi:5-hydroxyisourate hydrolase
MSAITTHILDISLGKPAAGIDVALDGDNAGAWHRIGRGQTDADGRLRTLMPTDAKLPPGVYRLVFDTKRYFTEQGRETLYPEVVVVFETTAGNAHYHVPLLISPFGYSTYRGS